MNEQIKVKKLPVDYLVLDYWVPSGNKDFVSLENNYTDEEIAKRIQENDKYLRETGEQPIPLDIKPKEVFGTKHIQLVAVNQEIEWFGEGADNLEYYFIDINGNEVYEGADADTASGLQQLGKDCFIYKVSEEK